MSETVQDRDTVTVHAY